MCELAAFLRIGLDAARPGDGHRVVRAAQVAGHLLAPLERRVVGMRPGRRKVRCGVKPAQFLDAAELLDDCQLLLGVQHDAIEEGRLVEGTRGRAFHAGAVVTPDVDDERVVELAHRLDFVDQAAYVPVSVFREAGKNLHLPGVELLLGVVERIPGRIRVRSGRQLGVRRDDAELLLALKGFLTVLIPAIVELALVFVRPFLRNMMRRMGGAGGVIDEPWLVRVMCADGVQPLDGLVGDVVGEVIELPVLALGDAENRVVLGDDWIVLAGGAGQKAPPVVKAPCLRPVLEGAGRPHLAARRHVPLAEAGGDVAVFLQDAGQCRATARPCTGVAGERSRKFGDAAHAQRWWLRPVRSAARVGEQTAVTWNAL